MKVSIIVPVYNASKYIRRCIESILCQTMGNFELLLIDDGSSDDSVKILKEYSKIDKRIKVIEQENMGVAKTRNKGIKLATGEYVLFIDNDDYINEDYLENFVKSSDDYDIVIGGYRRVSLDDKELMHLVLNDTSWSKYTFITPWARIYKRKFLLDKKIEFLSNPIGEDVYFNLNAYSKTDKIKIIPYVGYNWLYNDFSVSNTIHKGFNDKVDIIGFLDKIYNLVNDNNREYIKYYCYKFGIWYLLYSGKGATKDKFIIEYLKIKGWNKKNKIKMNIFPYSRKLSGETLFNRSSVFCFFVLDKLHLVNLFARIYCKNK